MEQKLYLTQKVWNFIRKGLKNGSVKSLENQVIVYDTEHEVLFDSNKMKPLLIPMPEDFLDPKNGYLSSLKSFNLSTLKTFLKLFRK